MTGDDTSVLRVTRVRHDPVTPGSGSWIVEFVWREGHMQTPKEVFRTNTSTQRFLCGGRYRVVKDGGYLRGFRPIGPSIETLWRKDREIGYAITCTGNAFTADNRVPIMRWFDADRKPLANNCEFQCDYERMWGSLPAAGFLVSVGPC